MAPPTAGGCRSVLLLFPEPDHAAVAACLPGGRADPAQPVHPAGAAVRVRACRPTVPAQHAAAAAGHGAHLHRGCQPGRGGQPVGGAGQPGRTLDRPAADGAVRGGAAVAATGRPSAGTVPARGRPPERACRCRRRGGTGRCVDIAADRHRHRPAVGALRGADPWPGADRCRPAWRQRGDQHPAAGVCAGRDHRAGAGGVGRRPRVPCAAGAAWPRRCAAQGAGRGRPAGGGGDRPGLGYRPADPPFHGQHRPHRAGTAGCGTRRAAVGTVDDDDGRCQRRCRCTAAGGRHPARAGRCHRLAQQPPAGSPAAARQGRADRFLDLLLHQLPARDAVRARMGAPLPRPRPGGDRRAHAGVRLRA